MTRPAPPWLLAAVARLNRTRLLPGFVHDHFGRLLVPELRTIFGATCHPVTTGMVFGWTPLPEYWDVEEGQ